MLQTNNFVFTSLKIIAWIIFVGLSIEAGGLIVNFIFSLFNPTFVENLYQNLDLNEMYLRSTWAFYSMYSFALIIAVLKAFLFYLVVVLVTKIDLSEPFSSFVSKQISKISYFTLSIGFLSYVARKSTISLQRDEYNIDTLYEFWADGEAFILMGAIVYVIAIIFKKGVEYQEELEETV